MKIIIHRGQHQIGGSIIEIKTEKTKIVFDLGISLEENMQSEYPLIDGLFKGEKTYDGVFISHYHADHMGLLDKLLDDIPVYMGEKAYKIYRASCDYRGIETNINPTFIQHNDSIVIGDIEITPFSCDHSAYDSYMFLIKYENRTVLYTGDFRANGRMNYQELLDYLPEVDVMIVEGTTLSREESRENILESTLEEIAVKELREHTGPCFVMMSAMNIDRLITMGNVAKRTNRILLEDIYTAQIAEAAGEAVPQPNKLDNVRVFVTDGNSERHKQLEEFGNAKIGKHSIAKENYIMCVRPSMINYIKKLNELQSFEDGILFYGMWKGYQEKEDISKFLEYMKSQGVKVHTLHTSGHADSNTIDNLIQDVKPKTIIPVHTENEQWFDRYKSMINVLYNTNQIEL